MGTFKVVVVGEGGWEERTIGEVVVMGVGDEWEGRWVLLEVVG